jgi:hypothetical protein
MFTWILRHFRCYLGHFWLLLPCNSGGAVITIYTARKKIFLVDTMCSCKFLVETIVWQTYNRLQCNIMFPFSVFLSANILCPESPEQQECVVSLVSYANWWCYPTSLCWKLKHLHAPNLGSCKRRSSSSFPHCMVFRLFDDPAGTFSGYLNYTLHSDGNWSCSALAYDLLCTVSTRTEVWGHAKLVLLFNLNLL